MRKLVDLSTSVERKYYAMLNKRCEHRHTIESHPGCFNKQFYELEGQKVGYLDIEATDLNANSAWMLSWAVKTRGFNAGFDNIVYNDIFIRPGKVNRAFDKRITAELLEVMAEHTVLVTYYGTGFDLPFIRTRAMMLDLKFPKVKTIAHIDLYYHVRGKMSLNKNSLAMATKALDISGKTHLDFAYWKLAGMGDEETMQKLIKHNVEDVKILESLHKKLEPLITFKRSAYV